MTGSPLRMIVLARDQSPRVQNAWADLRRFLESSEGIEIVAAEVTEDLPFDGLEAELVVVLGGDGAILRACRKLGENQLPILGVNLGRLGFLADVSPEEFRRHLDTIRERRFHVTEHLMFEATLATKAGGIERHLGLNEVAISAAGAVQMIDIELTIDGERVTTFSGDGLIVSTPVGSTAHSLSAGGPILRQELQAFVVTPICPHALTNRPIVDAADRVYTLAVPDAPEGTTLVIDGQIKRPLGPGDTVSIRRASVTFRLARIPGHSFYATLHRKLGWGGQPAYQAR